MFEGYALFFVFMVAWMVLSEVLRVIDTKRAFKALPAALDKVMSERITPAAAREAREIIRKFNPALAMRLDHAVPVEEEPKPAVVEPVKEASPWGGKFLANDKTPVYTNRYDAYTNQVVGMMRVGDKYMAQRMSRQMYDELNCYQCECNYMIESGNGDCWCADCGTQSVYK